MTKALRSFFPVLTLKMRPFSVHQNPVSLTSLLTFRLIPGVMYITDGSRGSLEVSDPLETEPQSYCFVQGSFVSPVSNAAIWLAVQNRAE